MTLHEWIDGYVARCGHRRAVHLWMEEELAKRGTPITRQTIYNIDRGLKLERYDKAKALSDFTGGEVTVEELCE